MKPEHYRDREQTAVKHQILERYLKAFTPIIGSWASEIVYVDCLAGPWKSATESLEDTSFHRALNVFRNAIRQGRCRVPIRALLIEKDAVSFEKLNAYAQSVSDINVRAENWDFELHIDDIVEFATRKKRAFPFLFIDPKGWELIAIDTITPILKIEPGEVLITFMSSWVKRFLPDTTKPFHRLVGQEDLERLRGLEGDVLEDELVGAYSKAVRKAGRYEYTCALPILKPDQDAFNFHMIYGTRHPRGVEVFKEAERNTVTVMHELRADAQRRRKTESTGQGFLLTPSETYRESRFSRFRAISLQRAHEAMLTKLAEAKNGVTFKALVFEALQYSVVFKEDVVGWIMEKNERGDLTIENWTARQKVPHDNQVVHWGGRQSPLS